MASGVHLPPAATLSAAGDAVLLVDAVSGGHLLRRFPLDLDELPSSRWFGHYADVLPTVEVNNTFYPLQNATTFDDWVDRATRGFRYASSSAATAPT